MRGAVFLVLTLLVSACQLQLPTLGGRDLPQGPRSVALLDGSVAIAAPEGFCLDLKSSAPSAASPVLFFGACKPFGPRVVITAVVAAEATPGILANADPAALSAYFQSERGRAALARSGNADDVTLLTTEPGEGYFAVQLTDRGASEPKGLAPDYWRAVTEVNGHLVTLSVLGFTDHPLPSETIHTLLLSTVARVVAANAVVAASGPAPSVAVSQ